MKVYKDNKSFQENLKGLEKKLQIGFVPTMGALHQGHLALMKRAKIENQILVVSIFVNPTQFDNKKDLINYPRTLEADLKLLRTVACDMVFIPSVEDIYNTKIRATSFDFDGLEFEMEGKHRIGHFDGVGTVVKKLLELVKPHNAYFGEKDFQQLQIIKKLVSKHKLPVQIIGCAIHREADGLAMSSRNVRLTKAQRKAAPFIYKTLQRTKALFKLKSIPEIIAWVHYEFDKNPVLKLEYFEIANIKTLKSAKRKSKKSKYRGFIAVHAGEIRLIDNLILN